jgi:hypothetical protein
VAATIGGDENSVIFQIILMQKRGEKNMNIFYIIGVIVVVVFVAGFLGLR